MIRRRRSTGYTMSCLEATNAMRAMTAALAGHNHAYAESITEMQIARARRLYVADEIDVPELERQIAEALRA